MPFVVKQHQGTVPVTVEAETAEEALARAVGWDEAAEGAVKITCPNKQSYTLDKFRERMAAGDDFGA